MTEPDSQPRRTRLLALYAGTLLIGAAAFVCIRGAGSGLTPGLPAASGDAGAASHMGTLAHVLLALAVITLVARLVGQLLRRFFGQPPVIGEILSGLMLGPSLLGAVWPQGQHFLLPDDVAPLIAVISKIGVVLFMFLVGLEMDARMLRGSTRSTLAISHASIVLPFVLGAGLALWIYPRYATANVDFTSFALFIGASMSITAFPVLARILTDRGMSKTPLGITCLACAAVGDATAWTLLAVIVGIASATIGGALRTVLYVVVYVTVMLVIVRPMVRNFVARADASGRPVSRNVLAACFVTLLLSAFATEAIGIHALFGAFLLGVLLPNEGKTAEQLRAALADVVVVLFLPSFFAYTGMRTHVGLLDEPRDWLVCGVVIVAATIGKFGGAAGAARFVGHSWRDASAIGALMNTRGLMELIALALGLDLGIITPTVFTMFVLMALVTTFMAVPMLDRILGRRGEAGGDARPDVPA